MFSEYCRSRLFFDLLAKVKQFKLSAPKTIGRVHVQSIHICMVIRLYHFSHEQVNNRYINAISRDEP